MTESVNPFLWSDAWFLLAAGIASSNGRPTLAAIVGAADGIQHAIITKPELDGAIGRLQRAGLVVWDPPFLTVTTVGNELLQTSALAGASLLKQQESLEAQLAAGRWTSAFKPSVARLTELEAISSADYARAVSTYRGSF